MPFKPHEEILSYEDMVFFVQAAVELGISKVRITGGEPLVRKGLPDLVGLIRAIPGIRDISLTTNGVLLPRFAEELKDAGLDRVNISVDSLDPERYRALTRGGSLEAALAGVEAALRVRSRPGEAQRGHDARAAGGTARLRRHHPRPAAARALHRVDAGGRLRSPLGRRVADQGPGHGRTAEDGRRRGRAS